MSEIPVLPCDNDDKVHDVPHVPEVAAGMEHEALGQNLQAGLNREDAQEVGLGGFLELILTVTLL